MTRLSNRLVIATATLLGMTIALPVLYLSPAPINGTGPARADPGTPVPFEYHALTDDGLAIERALTLFPEEKDPSQVIARLTTRLNAVSWQDGATPIPGDYDPSRLAKPGWIVGVMGTGVTSCDMAPIDMVSSHYGQSCDDQTFIAGIYYVLDPANAMVISMGELTPALHQELTMMQNEQFQIVSETPAPLTGVVAPSPPYSVPQIVTTTPEP